MSRSTVAAVTVGIALPASVAIAMLALAGCSTPSMTKQECRTVDWRTIGYEDGVAGRPGDRIGAHRRACADYGITPDLAAYQAGRTQGLREFCQPHNGYSRGADGTDYYGDCPADLAAGFEKGYDVGRELYVRQRRVIDTEEAMADRRREIRRLEDRVTESAFDVVDQSATPESRVQGAVDAKQAAERIPRLRKEIAELEKDRVRFQAEYDAYRNTVAATY